jgi:hypothetical protein
LTLSEEHRLKVVFENKVLRRIFGPKKDEMTGRDGTGRDGTGRDGVCSTNGGEEERVLVRKLEGGTG